MDSKDMAGKLNQLLKKNIDAEKGFREAADEVKNERLQSFLMDKVRQRYEFKHQLESEIRDFGESPEEDSTLGADMHRSWMNLKTAFTSNDEEAILEETAKGEKNAIEEYNKVIKDDNFPPSTLNMLIKQRNEIKKTLQEVKELEGSF